MVKLPLKYLENMKELLQDEFDDYLDSFNNPIRTGLRVNTKKISVEDFIKLVPFELERIPWTSNGFYVKESDLVTKHPYYHAGLYYVQEASAMFPGQVLEIKTDDIVLDGCASPGGKSTQLGLGIENGLLVSNDISSSRQIGTVKNVELFGFDNCVVMAEDVIKLAERYSNCFNKVLIDAPCSGEGMFHKDGSLIGEWYDGINDKYSALQKDIIEAGYQLLKQGGQLLYSTCTFSKKENEDVISYLLDKHPELTLVPIKSYEGMVGGIGIKEAKRLYPHKLKGEGHFVCLIQKGENVNEVKRNTNSFRLEHISKEFKGNLVEINDKLYAYNGLLDLTKMRILRSGLLIGSKKHDKIIFSQALALNLKKEEFDQVIDLNIDDIRVNKYLAGETIFYESDMKGYVLICVSGYPLGFGIIDHGVVKNKLEKGFVQQ